MVSVWFFVLGLVSATSAYLTKDSKSINPKDINQWNIVQIVPPNDQSNNQQQSSPPSPGFVWIQVPASNFEQSTAGHPAKIESKPPNHGSSQPPVNPVTAVTPSGTGLNKLCLNPKGQFPSTTCNKFVNCWNGVATEQECPPGLLFSSKGYCDYPENVNCNGKPIQGQGSTSSVSTPEEVTSLSPPTRFSDQTSSTILSSHVTEPTVATLPPANPSLKKKCLQPRGQFPSTSCKKYVNCWDDAVVEQECPDGLLFSTKGYCDYQHNVDCGDRGTSKVVLPESSECPKESGSFREKNDCALYFTCVFNKIVARYACPEGFKFSERLGVCDHESKVDCSEEAFIFQKKVDFVPAEKYHGTNGNIQQNDCSVEYGTFRDFSNCNTYYTCASFKIVSKHDCPPGFSFNDDIGICDYSYKVDCTKPPRIYEITKNSILKIPQEYRERVSNCRPGSVIPLNVQCTAACLCRNGLAEVIQCPSGFAYDSALDKCVLAHLARC